MKNILPTILILLAGMSFWASLVLCNVSQYVWPEILPFKKSFYFADPNKTEAKMDIFGRDGTPLYLLECHLGPHEDPAFDYSGDFECRLTSLYSKDAFSTLLTENPKQSRDWQSRGRFLIEELIGKCAVYPEYGKIRHFKLRGMELTLGIKSLKMQVDSRDVKVPKQRARIKELYLDVDVIPDPTASSEIAEPTKYVEPPYANPEDPNDMSRNCEAVLKR